MPSRALVCTYSTNPRLDPHKARLGGQELL
jgi:hypothetical protein